MALFHDRDWRERMTVRLDINGMMAAMAGDDGVKEETANSLIPRLQRIQTGGWVEAGLRKKGGSRSMGTEETKPLSAVGLGAEMLRPYGLGKK